MNQEIDYCKKYLKYKSKYNLLKKSIGGSEKSNDSPLSWKNEPNFVPEFTYDDPTLNTVNPKDQNCKNSTLMMYNFVVKKEDDKKVDQKGGKKKKKKDDKKDDKIVVYKWCDDEAIDVSFLNSGIRNKNATEVVRVLFLGFISKIFNIKSEGKTLNLFSIDFEANKAKCHIRLNITHHSKALARGYPAALGWNPAIHGNSAFGSREDKKLDLFYVSWIFSNEKTNVKELFDENKHFKDGYFGKVKKATIDGKEIDIEKFKSKSSDFAIFRQRDMNHILQEFAFMINRPSSDNCTNFLKKFHSFWNKSHKFYESIKK